MTNQRVAHIARETSESSIDLSIDLDGTGTSNIQTSVPFYDHLLTAFSKHSLIDLAVRASGDIEIDVHHTVEDVAIVLGQAIRQALGDKSGIARFGDALVPLDEALVQAVVDISGRPYLVHSGEPFSSTSSAATSPGRWCATSSRRSPSTPVSPCTSPWSAGEIRTTSPRRSSRPSHAHSARRSHWTPE
jgi:imidazoleglycerol phosphate dehydratase HisB